MIPTKDARSSAEDSKPGGVSVVIERVFPDSRWPACSADASLPPSVPPDHACAEPRRRHPAEVGEPRWGAPSDLAACAGALLSISEHGGEAHPIDIGPDREPDEVAPAHAAQ